MAHTRAPIVPIIILSVLLFWAAAPISEFFTIGSSSDFVLKADLTTKYSIIGNKVTNEISTITIPAINTPLSRYFVPPPLKRDNPEIIGTALRSLFKSYYAVSVEFIVIPPAMSCPSKREALRCSGTQFTLSIPKGCGYAGPYFFRILFMIKLPRYLISGSAVFVCSFTQDIQAGLAYLNQFLLCLLP